mgnify:CR=1 FL=1
MAINRKLLDRKLPERSKLLFYFPRPEEGDAYTVIRMPFYENPQIVESKRARYQDHKLISRSSNLYTYLGADSRRLSLSFNISLPHLQEELVSIKQITRPNSLKAKGSSADKDLFLTNSKMSENAKKSEILGAAANKLAKDYRDLQRSTSNKKSLVGFRTGYIAEKSLLAPSQGQVSRREYAGVISYWINVIRSSVVNNASNPLYGPPIIRLRHGILYQDIPLICKDYSIQHMEEAGYDSETLLPRIIKVTMNLEEFRAGNFGEFDSNSSFPLDRDNLAGWEAVIESSNETADPGLGYLGDVNIEPESTTTANPLDAKFNVPDPLRGL